jgi:hypothetical protein
MALDLYGEGIMGCRKIARVFEILLKNSNQKTPHHTTIQQWIWRNGCYNISTSLPSGNDWVAIGDLSFSMGKKKVLVILGVQMKQMEEKGSQRLSHRDVTILGLYPCDRSNGQFVHKSLKESAERVGGSFMATVIDQGPDIKKGATLLRDENQENMVILFDISHKLANLLERTLKNDRKWMAYSKALGKYKNRAQQTEFAALMPPAQRKIAKFMDVSQMVYWPRIITELKMKGNLDSIPENRFQEYLGWIDKFKADCYEWELLVGTIEMITMLVAEHGLSQGLCDYLEMFFQEAAIDCREQTGKCIKAAINAVAEEAAKLKAEQTLICSTEVLESIFGKYKAIMSGSAQGVTGNVLGMYTFVGCKQTEEHVQKAMEGCSVKSSLTWVKEKIGTTIGSLRKIFFKKKETKFDNQPEITFAI